MDGRRKGIGVSFHRLGGHETNNYDLSPDNMTFLMLRTVDRQAETVVVYNWAAELRKGAH